MCWFHSFVWVEGERFLEEPGEVSHSVILSNAGLDGDSLPVLLPEFDVIARQVNFEGKRFVDIIGNSENPSLRIDRSSLDRFLGQRALRRLEGYLQERFGSPEALAEFAKDYWDVGVDHLRHLVVPSLSVPPPEQCNYVILAASGESFVLGVSVSDNSYMSVFIPSRHFPKGCVSMAGSNVALFCQGRLVLIARGGIVDWLRGDEVMLTIRSAESLDGRPPIDEIRVWNASETLDYSSWRKVFLDKRYRVSVWNKPFDFDYALGFRKRPIAPR